MPTTAPDPEYAKANPGWCPVHGLRHANGTVCVLPTLPTTRWQRFKQWLNRP